MKDPALIRESTPAEHAAAAHLREQLVAHLVPLPLHDGLIRYFVHHIRPGSFLRAALALDIVTATARADEQSLTGLRDLVRFLEVAAPPAAWGSHEAVASWTDRNAPYTQLAADVENSMHGGER